MKYYFFHRCTPCNSFYGTIGTDNCNCVDNSGGIGVTFVGSMTCYKNYLYLSFLNVNEIGLVLRRYCTVC